MTDIQHLLDNALEAAEEFLHAGAMGRQEKALVRALSSVVEAVRELAPAPKAAAAPRAEKSEPKHKAEPAKKAPAKKAAAKK